MAFTRDEYASYAFKGWLGILGAGNRFSAPDNLTWYEESTLLDTIVTPSQLWGQFASIPSAADVTTARANAVAFPTIIEDYSLAVNALRLTPSSNEKLFYATSVYGNLATRIKNWIMPQLIPLSDGTPSIGYMMRLWNGAPSTGGTEITTTAGKVDAFTAWVFNFGAGAALFCSDEAIIVDPTDLWITGFTYIGISVSGTGDVIGPGASVAHNFPQFADISGKLLEDSGYSSADFSPLAGSSSIVTVGIVTSGTIDGGGAV